MTRKASILIVDDEAAGRATMESILAGLGTDLHLASNGAEALEMAAAHPPDLVLLDVMMPGMDGFDVCRRLRADPVLAELPIIIATALDDRNSKLMGLEAGADDFVTKPIDRIELIARVQTILRLNRYRKLVSRMEALERAHLELEHAYDATVESLIRALDSRDHETEQHTQRVMKMAVLLARRFEFSEAEIGHVRRGALLHDVGKIGIPDGILGKPGPLTEAEWAIMRRHPQIAFDMLRDVPYLRPALDIPYCHHEKWDGTGYPRGLAGEAIPLSARIFAVVDIWDALSSDRPYRAAWDTERVLEHLRSLAGTHLDPKVVATFIELAREYPRPIKRPSE